MEPKSLPDPDDRTPGTFSQTTHRGARAPTSCTNRRARLPRGSASPPRSPATEKDWQGLPPMTRSGFGYPRSISSVIAVTSPRFGMPGHRFSTTAIGNLSISAVHRHSQPSGIHAACAAPMPSNRLTYLMRPTGHATRAAAADAVRSQAAHTPRRTCPRSRQASRSGRSRAPTRPAARPP